MKEKNLIIGIVIVIIIIAVAVLIVGNNNRNNNISSEYSESEIINVAKKKALTYSVIDDKSLRWTYEKIIARDEYARLIVDLKYTYEGTANSGEVLVNIWEADNFYRYRIKTVKDESNKNELIQEIKEEANWNKPLSHGM